MSNLKPQLIFCAPSHLLLFRRTARAGLEKNMRFFALVVLYQPFKSTHEAMLLLSSRIGAMIRAPIGLSTFRSYPTKLVKVTPTPTGRATTSW